VNHPINGVATSITAFIGRALRGPTDAPGSLNSFGDFQRLYGGLWAQSTLGYAVNQFFLNGGSQALIVRVHNVAAAAKSSVPAGGINLIAANAGAWGNSLRARVDLAIPPSPFAGPANGRFNLRVKDLATGTIETFANLSTDPNNESFVASVLAAQSQLVRVDGPVPANAPPPNAAPAAGADSFAKPTATSLAGGGDGGDISDAQISDPGLRPRGGLWMLDQADLLNLLCIPPLKRSGGDVGKQSWDAAIAYAKSRRAFVIVDPVERWTTAGDVLDTATGVTSVVTAADNAAIYFPRILVSDPLTQAVDSFAPGGTVAGIFAETDVNRGVWKAPAGVEAAMQGALGLSLGGSVSPGTLTDADSGLLNPTGVNSFRNFPTHGTVVWGARTLKGADALASDWKYIPVRRLAYYIEESVVRGMKWATFEPNDQALWAQIELSVNAFMQTLFMRGAFQGTMPPQAFFVKCDSTTTTPADMENGVVNIVIGFAPIKPAEFVVLTIQQTARVG
jgi:Bacteriophage tail sheath protein